MCLILRRFLHRSELSKFFMIFATLCYRVYLDRKMSMSEMSVSEAMGSFVLGFLLRGIDSSNNTFYTASVWLLCGLAAAASLASILLGVRIFNRKIENLKQMAVFFVVAVGVSLSMTIMVCVF